MNLPLKKPEDEEVPKWGSSGLLVFLQEILANPGAIGAACPSTKHLARRMANEVPLGKSGYVVELGPGTGVVTEALLHHGIDNKKLILIERSAALTKHLKKRFPHLRVIQGDAIDLVALIGSELDDIDVVVSSLPLKSLPDEIVDAITQQAAEVLKPGGLFIQYTYDLRHAYAHTFPCFKLIHAKRVWFNLPPARILVYQRQPDPV